MCGPEWWRGNMMGRASRAASERWGEQGSQQAARWSCWAQCCEHVRRGRLSTERRRPELPGAAAVEIRRASTSGRWRGWGCDRQTMLGFRR
jgi:hypothetical protein